MLDRKKEIIEAAKTNIESNLNVIFLLDLADYKGGIIREFEVNVLFNHRFKLEQCINDVYSKYREAKREAISKDPNVISVVNAEREIKELLKQLDTYNKIVERDRMVIVNDCLIRLKECQGREGVPHSVKRIDIKNLRNIQGF